MTRADGPIPAVHEGLCRDCMIRGSKALLQAMLALPAPPAAPILLVRSLVAHAASAGEASLAEIEGRCRSRSIVDLRRAVAMIAREATGMSYPEIGRFLGGRDHSTVINLRVTGEDRARRDPQFAVLVERIRADWECDAAPPAFVAQAAVARLRAAAARRRKRAEGADDEELARNKAMIAGSEALLGALRREHRELIPHVVPAAAAANAVRAGYCREAIA